MESQIRDQIHLESGDGFYEQGKYIKAKKEYNKALAIDPNNAEAHNGLGRVALVQQRYEEAERFFRKATELNPQEPVYHNNLGVILRNLKRYAEAEEGFRAALNLNKDYYLAHSGLGDLFFEQKRYDEARAEFEKLLFLNSKDPEAHNNLGRVAVEQKRYEEAEQCFRKAIELDPAEPVYHSNLGLALRNLKRFEEAEKEYRVALDFDKDYHEARNKLGDLFFDQKRYDEARAEFERHLSFNSKDPEAHNGLGRVALLQERYEEAERFFHRATELNPQEPAYHSNWGLSLENLKRYDEAIEKYNKATQVKQDYADGYFRWGFVLSDLKRYDEAIEKYEKAIQIDQDDPYPRHNIAHLFFWRGMYKEGWDSWELALDIYRRAQEKKTNLSRTADFFQNYGDVLRSVFERLEDAEVVYREGLKIDPSHTGILHGLVELYLGKAEEDPSQKSMYCWKAREACNKADKELSEQLQKNEDAKIRLQLGRLFLLIDRCDDAKNHLLKALEKGKDQADIYNTLGVIYNRKEDFKKAAEYFKDALQREPDDLNIWSNLAEVYLKLNLKDKAEQEYKKILRVTPGHVESHIGLGEVYLAMGGDDEEMYDRAIRCFSKALEIADTTGGSKKLKGKDRAAVLYSRGYARVMFYEKASVTTKNEKQLRNALKDFKECFDMDRDNHKAERNKEKLAKRLSRFSVGWFTDKVAPWVISGLSAVVFILSQLDFYFCMIGKAKIIESVGSYALLTFGSLIFMIAGLYLPQILKLKVGGIELEKKPVEQITTSVSLGITR